MVMLLFVLFLATQEVGLKQPLELKAYVEAPSPWFPSQEGKIFYQIRYQGKIQLTSEELPMLEPKRGFEKVGDKVVENYDELDYSVQNIYQKIRPTQSGHFVFPPSHIEGFRYEIRGGHIVPTDMLKSDLPAYEVDIAPFPIEGQPPTFNGSVGSFQFSLDRIGNGPTQVGDWIPLALTAQGPNLSGLRLPNIACLPGIVGFFRLNDLPIDVTESEGKRTYSFQIAPIVAGITEIPPLSWSVYDPKLANYSTWRSAPIPLSSAALSPRPARKTPSEPIAPLVLPQKEANQLLEKGEIPLALLSLQRAWRINPWSREIPNSIHALETRAGLPLSSFPFYPLLQKALGWFLIPFLLYALWKKSIPLLATALILSLFLLWYAEKEAIVLTSTLPDSGSNVPFLAGETVNILSSGKDTALISSKKQIGQVPRHTLIDI